jgi:hypothetical protein
MTLPTPRMYAQRGPDYSLCCRDCRHLAFADYAALIAAGRGDTPLVELRWRCAKCGSRAVDGVVTGARSAGFASAAQAGAGGQ